MTEQAAMPRIAKRESATASPAQRRKLTFFVEFTIVFGFITLMLTLVTGFVVGGYLGNDVKQGAIDDVVTEVTEVTSTEATGHLQGQDLSAPLEGDALERFDLSLIHI